MELAFNLPHLMELPALTPPWTLELGGKALSELARFGEKLGYAMIAVPEHYVIPNDHIELSGSFYMASYPAMAYFAGATETIRVNSCISLLPVMNPIITAKMLSSMDWLSGGRVTVTFASGWLKEEFDALGVDFHQRGAMAEEYIQAIIALWTQEKPEFEGKYVKFRDIAFEPKCIRKPHLNVWFGGDDDRVLRRIGRYASGWWPFLTKAEDLPARLDYIRSQPDYSGQLQEVFFVPTAIGEGHLSIDNPDARPAHGKQEIIDRLGRLAGLGATMSSVGAPAARNLQEYRDHAQWVAEEIMPAIK